MNEPDAKPSLYLRVKRWRKDARRYAGRVFAQHLKLIHDAVVVDDSKRPHDKYRD